jgi:hypothetical protein
MFFITLCSWASRRAYPHGVAPPDRFWISVANCAMVKVSYTYVSHLFYSPSARSSIVSGMTRFYWDYSGYAVVRTLEPRRGKQLVEPRGSIQ